jgi:ABC-2 type transport system ATP-binding protein
MSDDTVVLEGVTKRFGEVVALDGLDLAVAPGTVYGLLGPNGAGKTTAVRILTTLSRPDSGHARVLGLDEATANAPTATATTVIETGTTATGATGPTRRRRSRRS